MSKRIFFILLIVGLTRPAFGAHLIDVDQALKKIYREADRFERRALTLSEEQIKQVEDKAEIIFSGPHSQQLLVYNAYQGDVILGTAFEDTVVGKWGPIHYVVGLDVGGKILSVIILDYDEIRGKPIAKRRFLKQYREKDMNSSLKLMQDIDGVTGATISSRSLTDGIRKIVHIFHVEEFSKL